MFELTSPGAPRNQRTFLNRVRKERKMWVKKNIPVKENPPNQPITPHSQTSQHGIPVQVCHHRHGTRPMRRRTTLNAISYDIRSQGTRTMRWHATDAVFIFRVLKWSEIRKFWKVGDSDKHYGTTSNVLCLSPQTGDAAPQWYINYWAGCDIWGQGTQPGYCNKSRLSAANISFWRRVVHTKPLLCKTRQQWRS